MCGPGCCGGDAPLRPGVGLPWDLSATQLGQRAQPVAAGEVVRWKEVAADEANSAVRVWREMEQMFAAQPDMVVT